MSQNKYDWLMQRCEEIQAVTKPIQDKYKDLIRAEKFFNSFSVYKLPTMYLPKLLVIHERNYKPNKVED